jgi:hypothetical protein
MEEKRLVASEFLNASFSGRREDGAVPISEGVTRGCSGVVVADS